MVRIPGFHPGDPGSSPGVGIFIRFSKLKRDIKIKHQCTPEAGSVVFTTCLIRLAVRTPRCGRGNPGSNPGLDIFVFEKKTAIMGFPQFTPVW